jgi:predicted DNA-binding transcriptional regulator AlpA
MSVNEMAEQLEKPEEELDRMIFRPEIYQVVGLGDIAIRQMEKTGAFPQRVHIGLRKRGWRMRDIQQWLDSRPPVAPGEPRR